MTKILILSDLHIACAGTFKFGLDTSARFAQAVHDINTFYGDADLCIFAGDIADSAEPEAYRIFDDMRAKLNMPQFVMLGNHDNRTIYLEHCQPSMLDPNGFVQGSYECGNKRIIMLDTSEPGHVEGKLCQLRLAWLQEQLAEAKASMSQVVLVLHHNPQVLHMPVDRYSLAEPEKLLEVLKACGADISLIVAGHCHISSAGSWGGYPVVTISGNQHSVAPFLTGMTGQQACYEGPAQFGILLWTDDSATFHFHNYVNRNIEIAPAMFPWKLNQWQRVPKSMLKA